MDEGIGLPLDNDYFNANSFLADSTLVEVKALNDAAFAAFADPKLAKFGTSPHIEKGHKFELPLSTAAILARLELVALQLPSIYNKATLTTLKAHPLAVDCRSLHPHYFEFGMKLANILEDANLANILLKAAEVRIIALLNYAEAESMSRSTDVLVQAFLAGLTVTEAELFHKKVADFTQILDD